VDHPTDSRALPALYQIATLVGQSDEPRDVLRQILQTIIDAVGGVSGDVSLVNPDSKQLEVELANGPNGPSDEDLSMRLGQGITGWVAFHGKPQLVPDVTQDPRYVELREHVRTEIAAPMLGPNGHVMGVINIDGDRAGAFNAPDLDLLVRLTAEATIVINRHWELRNLRGKARQLESLISIGQSLVTQLEPEKLFNSIASDARQITGFRACGLFTYEPDAQTVRLVAYDGPTPDILPQAALPLDSCLVSSSIHTRKAIEYANVQSPEFGDIIDLPREPGLRSMLATPLSIEDETIGVLVVFTDQTHRFNDDEKRLLGALSSLGAVALQNSRLYARVFQSEATLRKNEQLTTLGLLAAEIAHEIRNPLTVLKLLFGTLKLDYEEGDPRATDARVITEKLNQLEAIVSRVLNFAKAPSDLHARWNATDIISDTILLIRLKLSQSKIQLNFTPPKIALLVDVHKGQLQQVLLNLLINATQAIPDGGTITVELHREDRTEGGENLRIDVVDTGRGIPPEMRESIFDSFLSGRPDGTGLGLAIAKRILLSHHGDILLRQTSASGTTMSILLPLVNS
jgi:signal transduction histidine kinase